MEPIPKTLPKRQFQRNRRHGVERQRRVNVGIRDRDFLRLVFGVVSHVRRFFQMERTGTMLAVLVCHDFTRDGCAFGPLFAESVAPQFVAVFMAAVDDQNGPLELACSQRELVPGRVR